jgi:hypothetical protein
VGNAISKILSECAYGATVVGGGDTLTSYPLTQNPFDACLFEYSGTGPTLVVNGVNFNNLYIALRKNVGLGSGFSIRATITIPGAVTDPNWFVDDGTNTDDDCCAAQSFTNGITAYDCGDVGLGGSVIVTPAC